MWVLLEAEDVLLFRDSRPFTAGEDFRAEGLFPPLPPPVAGAIRTALLSPKLRQKGLTFRDLAQHAGLQDVRDALGTADSLGGLHLAGPLACTYVPGEYAPDPWFALPADMLGDRVPRLRDDLPLPGIRKPLPDGMGQGHMAALPRDSSRDAAEADADDLSWLRAEAMRDYLTGGAQVARAALPVAPEVRTGIQRSAANTAATGRFYSAQMHRPEWRRDRAVGLLMRASLPPGYALAPQFVPLGGEGRSAFLRPCESLDLPLDGADVRQAIIEQIGRDGGRFRLYLATAGVFGGGLIPSCFPGRLLGIASGKPIAAGGWDLAANAPRSLRRAAPPGTVYCGRLYENTADAASRLLQEFHLRTTLQERDALAEAQYRAQMGFGLTLVGAWTKNADPDGEADPDGNTDKKGDAGKTVAEGDPVETAQ